MFKFLDRNKQFECGRCDFACQYKVALMKHMKIAHPILKDHACMKCNEIFLKISELKLHMETAHKERKAS